MRQYHGMHLLLVDIRHLLDLRVPAVLRSGDYLFKHVLCCVDVIVEIVESVVEYGGLYVMW